VSLYSYSAMSVKALRDPVIVGNLRRRFEFTLGEPTSYSWRFIAAGDVWYETEGEMVVAPYDLAEIVAVRE